jgi:excisionase family DNA binding protein
MPTDPRARRKKHRKPPTLDQYIAPIDVAGALSVSLTTVYKLLHTRELPATRVLGSIRIRREEFDAFVAKNSSR